jgi:ribonuclease HI
MFSLALFAESFGKKPQEPSAAVAMLVEKFATQTNWLEDVPLRPELLTFSTHTFFYASTPSRDFEIGKFCTHPAFPNDLFQVLQFYSSNAGPFVGIVHIVAKPGALNQRRRYNYYLCRGCDKTPSSSSHPFSSFCFFLIPPHLLTPIPIENTNNKKIFSCYVQNMAHRRITFAEPYTPPTHAFTIPSLSLIPGGSRQEVMNNERNNANHQNNIFFSPTSASPPMSNHFLNSLISRFSEFFICPHNSLHTIFSSYSHPTNFSTPILIWTDGSLISTASPSVQAGAGIFCPYLHLFLSFKLFRGKESSQRSELLAIIIALSIVPPCSTVHIFLDNLGVVTKFNYFFNSSSPQPPRLAIRCASSLEWQLLKTVIRIRFLHVTLEWVKGHAGDMANHSSDALATSAEIEIQLHPDIFNKISTPFLPLLHQIPISSDPRRLLRQMHELQLIHLLPARLQLPISPDRDQLLALQVALNGGITATSPLHVSPATKVSRFQLKCLSSMLPTQALIAMRDPSLSPLCPSCYLHSSNFFLDTTPHFFGCPQTTNYLISSDALTYLVDEFLFLFSEMLFPHPIIVELAKLFLFLSPSELHLAVSGFCPAFLLIFLHTHDNFIVLKKRKRKKKESKKKNRCLLAGKLLFHFSSFFYFHVWLPRCIYLHPPINSSNSTTIFQLNNQPIFQHDIFISSSPPPYFEHQSATSTHQAVSLRRNAPCFRSDPPAADGNSDPIFPTSSFFSPTSISFFNSSAPPLPCPTLMQINDDAASTPITNICVHTNPHTPATTTTPPPPSQLHAVADGPNGPLLRHFGPTTAHGFDITAMAHTHSTQTHDTHSTHTTTLRALLMPPSQRQNIPKNYFSFSLPPATSFTPNSLIFLNPSLSPSQISEILAFSNQSFLFYIFSVSPLPPPFSPHPISSFFSLPLKWYPSV